MVGAEHRRSTRLRISPPAPSTSTRPGCIQPKVSRSAIGIATSRSTNAWTSAAATTDWSMTLLSYVARSSTPAVIESAVPATATTVTADATGTGQASRWASMSATQAATASGDGGSAVRYRSCIRTEPMSIDCAALGPDASPRTSSVDPPPMSTTRTGSSGGVRRLRTAPSYASAASSAPDSTSGQTPSRACTPSRKTSAFEESRVADVAQKRTRETSCESRIAAYSSIAANARTSASSASRPVASTPWPSRTMRDSRTDTSGRSPTSSLMVLVPQSNAATSDRTQTQGPASHHAPNSVEHLVAEGVHPRSGRQRVRGQHVQALHAVRHAAGRDALDLGYLAQRGPIGQVRRGARRRTTRRARRPRRAAPPSPSSAPNPRGCRSSRRRAGRSGSTSSGTASRSAAAARW